MQNTPKLIGGLVVAFAIVIGGFLLLRHPDSSAPSAQPSPGAVSNTNAPAAGTVLFTTNTVLPNPSVFDYLVARTLLYIDGALGWGNGTSVPNYERSFRSSAISTSSALCTITNTLNATSSIEHLYMNFATFSPTSTLSLVIGTTTTNTQPVATSSGIATISVPANSTSTVITWDPGTNNDILGPNQSITFGVGGASSNAWYGLAGDICGAKAITDN